MSEAFKFYENIRSQLPGYVTSTYSEISRGQEIRNCSLGFNGGSIRLYLDYYSHVKEWKFEVRKGGERTADGHFEITDLEQLLLGFGWLEEEDGNATDGRNDAEALPEESDESGGGGDSGEVGDSGGHEEGV